MFAPFVIISEGGIQGGYVDGWPRVIFTHGFGISLSGLEAVPSPLFRAKERVPYVNAEKRKTSE